MATAWLSRGATRLLATSAAMAWLSACAPQRTNTTYTGEDIGRAAEVSFGTIVAERPVTVQAENSGTGTLGGAGLGGVAGSFIGGSDIRGNILGAVGGAILGGITGNIAENQVGRGNAVEFVIRQDDGRTISVVQTNELQLALDERVAVTRGARTRLARLPPPPPGA